MTQAEYDNLDAEAQGTADRWIADLRQKHGEAFVRQAQAQLHDDLLLAL